MLDAAADDRVGWKAEVVEDEVEVTSMTVVLSLAATVELVLVEAAAGKDVVEAAAGIDVVEAAAINEEEAARVAAGVSENRPPMTEYAAAQSVRDMP